MYEIAETIGRVSLNLKAVGMGDDFCIIITGGERPHVGSVALSISRPSLADPRENSASTSVLTITGHKEDEITRKVGHYFARETGKNVVVVCGFHLDNITKEELSLMPKLLDKMVAQLLNSIKLNVC